MIPIDYSGSLKEYNQFITDFRKEMKKVIGKGYIELLNLPMNSAEIKKKRKEYGKQGIKVYANG